jgi:hypothetical protein
MVGHILLVNQVIFKVYMIDSFQETRNPNRVWNI